MVTDNALVMLVFEHITKDPQQMVAMTAVALAESGGDERAHNNNPATRDDSYGLWQINMYGSLGPDRRRTFGLTSNNDLFNPETNAKIAGQLWRASGFTPWRNTYRSDAYDKVYPRAVAAKDAVTLGEGKGGGGIFGGLVDSLNPFGAVDNVVELLTGPVKWLGAAALWIGNPQNWVRILQVGGGLVLGVVAVSIALSPTVKGLRP
jgi:hypothetical protein